MRFWELPFTRGLLACCALSLLACQASTIATAKRHLQNDQPEAAKQQLLLAVQEEPRNAEGHFLLGKIYAEAAEYDAMTASLTRSAELDSALRPEIEQVRGQYWVHEYNAGVEHSQSGDFEMALPSFAAATVIDPGRPEAWRILAYLSYETDRIEAAIAAYQKVAVLDPEDTDAWYGLGVLYLNEGRYPEAVTVLSELVVIDPQHHDGHVNLAVAQVHTQDYAGAEASYRRAIEIDPAVANAYYNLGNLYWQQQDYDAALAAFGNAVELNPEDEDALYNLAITYVALEDADAALPLLRRLSQLRPESIPVWNELGRIYAHKGMIAESEAAYDRVRELSE